MAAHSPHHVSPSGGLHSGTRGSLVVDEQAGRFYLSALFGAAGDLRLGAAGRARSTRTRRGPLTPCPEDLIRVILGKLAVNLEIPALLRALAQAGVNSPNLRSNGISDILDLRW
ncbi:hypothetical protein [Actinokineospora sp.]|uniref:hypothetical protein n=1 Tax=Actinokineospora sp. TaxID=1872133 RepID=UPI004037BEA9